jgi:hypothetical protein
MLPGFDQSTRKNIFLRCDRFVTTNDILIESGDYDGFTIKTVDGEQRTFMVLQPGPSHIDVTDELKAGIVQKYFSR